MNTSTSAAENEDDGIGGDVGVSADGWLDREGGGRSTAPVPFGPVWLSAFAGVA